MLDKICEACYNYLILLSARDPRGPIVKKKMVGRVRFELTTNSLKGYCSTIELPTHVDAQAGIEPAQKTFAESRLTIRPLRG